MDGDESGDSLGDTIYRQLSDRLVRGVLRPEERLKIRDLAQEMGTSVTPVRDAVLRLVQEHALYLKTPRDIRVRTVGMDEYLEVREIRIEIEGCAAAAAAERATEADIRRLDKLVRHNARALRAGNKALTTELNQRFHFEIVHIARMPVRADILRRLWLRLGPWITENYAMTSPLMIDFHYAAVEAIRRRDPAAAGQALRDDLVIGGGAIMENYLHAQKGRKSSPARGTSIALSTPVK